MSLSTHGSGGLEEDRYRRRTPASERCYVEARRYLPGGDSRSPLFYPPYPAVMDRGEGCRLFDLDGNELIDFTGNHSALAVGYRHPHVLAAVERQLERGTCFPGPTEPQVRLARMLAERIGSVELVRFTSSGTEAAANAIRAARAFTGRPKVAKVEGGYHGTSDDALVSTHPTGPGAGERSRPRSQPSALGLAPGTLENVVVIPFNEGAAAARVIEAEHDRLAAVLVEPVLGSAGMIPADQGYLEALREVTRRLGILLIFDEVVSFRLAYGGGEEHFGVAPDLTILGKLIGGGFPLGGFGGRQDVMRLFDPSAGQPDIPHPGSLNANPISLTAGIAILELLTREAIGTINRLGESLRTRMREVFAQAGVAAEITGLGSLFGIHLTRHQVRGFRDTLDSDTALRHRIFLGLYNEGVLIDPRGVGTISTALGEAELERFIEALRSVLARNAGAPLQLPSRPV
jgi:glutamate-1-semialdehyde 2,1-aminomutase